MKIEENNGNLCLRNHNNKFNNAFKMMPTADDMSLQLNVKKEDCFCYNVSGKVILNKGKSSYYNDEMIRTGRTMLNLQNAAKYMVQFYYFTEEKYSCTNAKIEKLLSIASLIEMKFGNQLFIEAIYNKNCGIGFPQLGETLLADMTSGTYTCETRINDTINPNLSCPAYYITDIQLNENEKNLFTNVFREFGAYDSKKLGKVIDQFKDEILIFNNDNQMTVDFKKTQDFFNDKTKKEIYKNNRVFTYISNYIMEN